jgi:DNA-directed RNA polymerase subunit beta
MPQNHKSSPQITREYWGLTGVTLPELDLTKVQRESYQEFLDTGIREALDEINSERGIEDFTGKNWSLKFGEYHFGKSKYTPSQAKRKAVTFDMPLRVEATLTNKRTGEEQMQEVFLGDIPRMTDAGTFIINGIERAVVTQLVRSPGIFFSGDVEPSTGKMLYQAELRPLRGSWIEINVGKRDVITVKVDRRRNPQPFRRFRNKR